MIYPPKEISIKAITDFFDSKGLMFSLGLKVENFRAMSYPIEEIILEKYRAVLTRDILKERDLFDLFLIKDSLNADINKIAEKINSASLIKKGLAKTISEKLSLLLKNEFFRSDEKIEDMAILNYSHRDFEAFKEAIKPILIKICKIFLENVS